MANETANDLSNAINNLMETVGKLGQMQVELISNGINAFSGALEPLSKTSADLVGNAVATVNQVLQDITAAVTSKK